MKGNWEICGGMKCPVGITYLVQVPIFSCEPSSKLLRGGYIRHYIGDYYIGVIKGGTRSLDFWLMYGRHVIHGP